MCIRDRNNPAPTKFSYKQVHLLHYLVDYMIVGNIEKASADLKLQLQILKNLGYFPIDCEDVNFHEYDLLIEGIFGVGLSREVGGVYKEVIERINACGKPVICLLYTS